MQHVWHGLEQSLIDDAVDQCNAFVLVFMPVMDVLPVLDELYVSQHI